MVINGRSRDHIRTALMRKKPKDLSQLHFYGWSFQIWKWRTAYGKTATQYSHSTRMCVRNTK